MSYAKSSTGVLTVLDTNDYYPFGMNHLSSSMGSGSAFNPQVSPLNYKYNGKELQETGMYDYGARMYMSDIGRWNAIDPLAEQMSSQSVYNYGFNNPIRFIDPDGRKATEPMERPEGAEFSFPNGSYYNATVAELDLSSWMTTFNTGGGGSSATTFGQTQAYKDLMAAWASGGTGGLSNSNGVIKWWTSAADSYDENGNFVSGEIGTFNMMKLKSGFNSFMNDSFNWVQNHPKEFTSIAGTIEGSSQLVARGLKKWNAPSSISKSRIFAEVISTRLPASAQALGKYSTALKWGGRAVGAVGLANTFVQWRAGNISDTRAAFDGAMGVIGFLGPWGAGISLVYFGGVAIYETYYNDGKPAF